MGALQNSPVIPALVVSDPSIMGGDPVVKGTRVPADVIVAYLRGGNTVQEIFEDYPSLPVDGVDAVIRWAEITYGADWKSVAAAR